MKTRKSHPQIDADSEGKEQLRKSADSLLSPRENIRAAEESDMAGLELPPEWTQTVLGDLLREPLRNGHSARATTDEDGIRTLTLTAVTKRDFSPKNTKITCADPDRVKDIWLKPGDILIERANTPEYVGLAALYEGPEDFAIFPDLMIRVRIDESKAVPRFVDYWLLSASARRFFQTHARSTAGNFPKIDQGTIEKTPIPHPPLPEQKKIAHILSTVKEAIEAQERIIQTTTELKEALMHKLFTEGLRNEPQKQTEIGPVPESWEVVDLGDVINLFAGYAFKSDEGVSESNTQLLRMGNLYQNTLDLNRSPIFYPDAFADIYKRFVLKEGDMVMSLTGTSGKEDYGFTVRIPKTGNTLLLNQRVTRINVTDRRLQKDFAHHFLLSRKFLDHLYPTAKGMKQANLSTNAMKKLKLVLPSEAEQREIATCLQSLDKKLDVVGRKIAALQDLFRTLVHELMTAKTRVHLLPQA